MYHHDPGDDPVSAGTITAHRRIAETDETHATTVRYRETLTTRAMNTDRIRALAAQLLERHPTADFAQWARPGFAPEWFERADLLAVPTVGAPSTTT